METFEKIAHRLMNDSLCKVLCASVGRYLGLWFSLVLFLPVSSSAGQPLLWLRWWTALAVMALKPAWPHWAYVLIPLRKGGYLRVWLLLHYPTWSRENWREIFEGQRDSTAGKALSCTKPTMVQSPAPCMFPQAPTRTEPWAQSQNWAVSAAGYRPKQTNVEKYLKAIPLGSGTLCMSPLK